MTSLGTATTVDIGTRAHDVPLTLLIPLGATEQHGPHLPLATDTIIAEAIAVGAAAILGPTVHVAPAVPYGASGEHAGFSGTLSIGTSALTQVLIELGRSATAPGGGPFAAVVFVNGHGGNQDALHAAATVLAGEGRRVRGWWPLLAPSEPRHDAHAGWTETSLLLAIAPQTVRTDRAEAGNVAPLNEVLDALRGGGMRAVSSNGVLGNPAGASADDGHAILATFVDQLCANIRAMTFDLAPAHGEPDVT